MAVYRLPRYHPLAASEGWLVGDSNQQNGRSVAISDEVHTREEAERISNEMNEKEDNAQAVA
jgi:hypothetical protein